MVVNDAYSQFLEADIVNCTAAKEKLECIFATHGVPMIVKSEIGPHKLGSYMAEMGAKHHRKTPLWPQANLEAENFIKSLTKIIHAACTEKKDWKKRAVLLLAKLQSHSTFHEISTFRVSIQQINPDEVASSGNDF